MIAGAAGLAGNLGRKVSQHVPKLVPTWFPKGFKVAPWRPPGGLKMAPWRPQGGLASLGGLGAPKTDF